MIGLGTIIHTAAIVGGGLVGLLSGKALRESHQRTVIAACGVSVLFIGINLVWPSSCGQRRKRRMGYCIA